MAVFFHPDFFCYKETLQFFFFFVQTFFENVLFIEKKLFLKLSSLLSYPLLCIKTTFLSAYQSCHDGFQKHWHCWGYLIECLKDSWKYSFYSQTNGCRKVCVTADFKTLWISRFKMTNIHRHPPQSSISCRQTAVLASVLQRGDEISLLRDIQLGQNLDSDIVMVTAALVGFILPLSIFCGCLWISY